MRRILLLLTACAASLVAYAILFGFILERPLTVDVIEAILEKKLAYAQQARGQKIFIMAGSNARVSHSCAVLEKELGRPCANLGIGVDTGLDWIISRAKPLIHPGDLVYMPIEYVLYSKPREAFLTGMDAAYRFRHDKLGLMARGPEGFVRAAMLFDLGTAIRSIGEMGLAARGVQRRSGVDTLNRQGDEIDHGDLKAKPYEALLRNQAAQRLDFKGMLDHSDGAQASIADFLDWCRANHVVAVGGLQTTYDDTRVTPELLHWLRAFYARHGARFVVLPNRSLYPRSEFFDTWAHLRDRGQVRHSHLVAAALRPLLPPAQSK